MIPSEEFLRHAAECRRMAKSIYDPGEEPFGCEWRSDGIVVLSWPVATIPHCNYVKQRDFDSLFTSSATWFVDQAALAHPFAIHVTSAAG